MKPAPFEYSAPESVDEALALLGEEAKVLAGGQSLVPLLNFRLARPERIVDINRVEELAYIRAGDGGSLRIGALARQAALERSQLVAERWPLLQPGGALRGPSPDPQPRHRRRLRRPRRPDRRAARGADGARRALPRPLERRRAHARAQPSCSAARSRRRSPRTSCSPRSRCRRCPPGRAAASASMRARTATSRWRAPPSCARRSHAAIALLGAGWTPLRAPAAERGAGRAAPRGRGRRPRGASSSSDEYRAALMAALVKRAVEEASA